METGGSWEGYLHDFLLLFFLFGILPLPQAFSKNTDLGQNYVISHAVFPLCEYKINK